MIGLSEIQKFVIPLVSLTKAYELMRYAGSQGVEAVALFSGNIVDAEFHINEVILPYQTSYKIEDGLLYSVSEDELYRINKFLYENKLMLGIQIHSHPGRAYHSTTDDAFPIVTVIGGLSIVVPNFAFEDISVDNWAIYRLSNENNWDKVASSIIHIKH